jgi:hypothetical protein
LTKLCTLALSVTTIILIAATSNTLDAQDASTASKSPSIVVSIVLEKESVPVGQSPWVVLTVRNLIDHDVPMHGSMMRLHVEGEKGERPTKLVQRSITGQLRPGEGALRGDEDVVWSIAPGESDFHKFKLTYFYDLAEPGNHSVYMDVMDPSSRKWLRTNTVRFEMQASTQ